MKITKSIMLLLCLYVLFTGILTARVTQEVLTYGWDTRFTETTPPVSPVRPVAEFEPASHVIIRYPLGIPVALVAQLSNTANVICLVGSTSQQNSATSAFNSGGVNMSRVSFMQMSTDSYWTRDFGPWFLYDGDGNYGVLDFQYNRPRPNDNMVPQNFATAMALPYYGMNIQQTGGNYMTDGINTAAQTNIAYSENNNNQSNVNTKMQNYLGITSYHVVADPNNTYIDHIDCWGKFLAPDKILIRSVPSSHAQYNAIEATAAYFGSQISAWGYPYKIYRVNTPNNQPYTNSLILNNKVFVPQMSSTYDAAALQVYRNAMPGYEVIGVSGTSSAPWESTDALHCRTHEVPDKDMLHISHTPYWGMETASDNLQFTATIIPHSGSPVYSDSLWVVYKVNSGNWNFLGLMHSSGYQYQANLSGFAPGDTIRYYIHAADTSGRSANHPVFANLDPHTFVIDGDFAAPEISHTPLTTIGTDPVTFAAIITDASNIANVSISYKVDDSQPITDTMIDAGNGMYLYSFTPNFTPTQSTFYYRIVANDAFNNSAYAPQEGSWYAVPISSSHVGDIQNQSPVLAIYPNPLRQGQEITFRYQSGKQDVAKLEIFNLRGQKVYSEARSAAFCEGQFVWNGRDLCGNFATSGVYFVRFSHGQNVLKRKLIIAY